MPNKRITRPDTVPCGEEQAPQRRRVQSDCDACVDEAGNSGRNLTLLDMDDASLLKVFSYLNPLPDLFSVAKCCKRFRDITMDPGLWLVVAPQPGGRHVDYSSGCHATLQAAVLASRPGDTIVLAPGAHIAADVTVRWPLRILGGEALKPYHHRLRHASPVHAALERLSCVDPAAADSKPPALESLLVCPAGGRWALECWASCSLEGVTVRAEPLGSCIAHNAGHLNINKCTLQCVSHPLHHLRTPLTIMPRHRPLAQPPARAVRVVETAIQGGGCTAVECVNGSAQVTSTRVIYSQQTAIFWFDVVHVDTMVDDLVGSRGPRELEVAC